MLYYLVVVFGCEKIVRFSDFVIHLDYMLSNDNYIIYMYEEGNDGLSTIMFNDPIPQIYLKEQYQIEKGRFN